MWKVLLSGVCLSLVSTWAVAADPPPERLAAECIAEVQQVVERVGNVSAEETAQCVRTINELQDLGRFDAAEDVANECVRTATQRARNAANYITRLCDACIDDLLGLGEIELARRVHSACEDGISDLRGILQREKSAIANALAD